MQMNLEFSALIEDTDISSFGLIAAVSSANDCKDEDFDRVIQILDESGDEVNITQDKLFQVFDQHGLNNFIL